MTRPTIKIHNVANDVVTEREMNAEEYAQYLKGFETTEAQTAQATARASALAKLEALGLSADEIAAL